MEQGSRDRGAAEPAVSREPIASIPGVCEVLRWEPAGGPAAVEAGLLIEVPHGATRTADYERLRSRLVSKLPADLVAFFHVNTDVGSFETAREVARRFVARRGAAAIVLKSSVPRTFVDCNRLLETTATTNEGRMTPAIADYFDAEEDRRLLESMHASYQSMARRAYERICGTGGLALQLHTYAPRSIEVGRIDGSIVEKLRRAYAPERYARWPRRPDVDIICRTEDDRMLAPASLVDAIEKGYAAIGIRVARSATYRLHPETLGYRLAESFPRQGVCVELSRALLADPFSPFEEMRIAPEAVDRMAGPLAVALAEFADDH